MSNPTTLRLEHKTALITGGTSGIGLAAAQLFARHGARVAVTMRDPERLKAAEVLGPDALVLRADVRSVADTKAAMQQVQDHFGHLDVLFLNAGAGFLTPLETVTEAQVDEMFGITDRDID